MRTLLYIAWGLFPLLFLLIALWAKLEQIADKHQRQNPGDFLRQAGFLLICVGISIVIDLFVLEPLVSSLASEWFPLWFFQLLLFPFVLLMLARIIGPSETIRINKVRHVSKNRVK